MKPSARLRSFLAITSSALLASPATHATTIYWDGASASWNDVANWTTAAGAITPNPGSIPGILDDLIFNRTGQNGNINIALDADQAALSLTFNSTGTTTIRGNTSGTTARALTIGSGGITKNSGSGAVGIAGGSVGVVNIALSANQTWTNNSASALSIGTGYFSSATDANVALGAFNLIIDGTGRVEIGVANQSEAVLTGTGTLTKNGTGVLQLGGANSGYSGNVFINGGVVNTGDATANATGTGNILINGGVLETRWSTGISRTQGTGANQIQITGGISGLSGAGSGSGAATHNIGAITWGSGTFNPTEFVLQSGNAGTGTTTLSSAINLGGAIRTIRSDQASLLAGGGTGTFSGAISNGGITKVGTGTHVFSATNNYASGTTISEGTLRFDTRLSMPATGTVTVADGATLGVAVAGSGTTWGSGTGVAGIAGLTSTANGGEGYGGQTGAVVNFNGNSFLNLNVTGNVTESNAIGNGTATSIRLIKSGASTLTLTSGSNSYSGGTTLTAGALALGHNSALGSGTLALNGGTIQSDSATARSFTNAVTIGGDFSVGGTGNLTFSNTGASALGATRTITVATGINATFAQAFSGSTVGITKAGAGTLTLTGNNSYTGATTIGAGNIVLNNDGDVSGSAVTFSGSNSGLTVTGGSGVVSTWNLNNGNFQTSDGSLSNVQVLIDGAGTAGSARVIGVNILEWGRTAVNSTLSLTNGGQMNVSGEVQIGNPYYTPGGGGANITIGGGTATSTFTGNTAQAFYIGFGEREGSNNNVVTVNSGGVLTSVGNMFVGHVNNQQGNDLASTANKLTVTGTGTASMASVTVGYAQQAGAPPTHPVEKANANIVEVTSGGTLTTSGVSYIGRANAASTEANANTLTVTGTGSSWNAGSQNVLVGFTNNATAVSNNNILTVGTGGTVTGIAALTVGSGTGTETGNQLVVNGSLTATSVSVSANNTLSGSGTITGQVTVNGIHAAGNSIGTQSIVGSYTQNGTEQVELGTPGATPSLGTSDLTAVTGNLSLGGSSTLQLINNAGANSQGSMGAGAYRLITFTGTRTGAFTTITNPLNATLHEKVVYNGTSNGSVDLEVYRLATGSTGAVSLGKTRVGGTLSGSATVTNSAAADGFSEKLNASVGGNAGDVISSAGSVSGVIAGASSSTINVALDTTTIGAKSGSVVVSYTSDGAGTSGYGTTANGSQTVGVTGDVYGLASANFAQSGGPAITGSGPSYTLDFGTGLLLNTLYTASFSIQNGVAVNSFIDTLTGDYGLTGASEFGTSAIDFSGLAAGAAANLFNITFYTTSAGTFSGTFSFDGTSVQSGLSDVSVGDFTIALNAVAVPEPRAALLGGLGLLMLLRRRR